MSKTSANAVLELKAAITEAFDKAIKHRYYLVGKSSDSLGPAQKYLAKNCFVTHNCTSLDLFWFTIGFYHSLRCKFDTRGAC